MPLPYYVSPEQMMKDKAEYARKGIARGKAIVALEYRDGVLLLAESNGLIVTGTSPNGKLVELVNWRWRTRLNSRLPPPMSSTSPLINGVLLIAPR